MSEAIAINGAFIGQRVTGQQRYAQEISRALLLDNRVRLISPPRRASHSAIRSWAWTQGPRLQTQKSEYLLSLTSRAPLYRPRHVVTVHDLFVITNPEWYSRKYVATHAPLLRAQLRTATGLVCVSEPTRDAVLEYLGTNVRWVVAPNAASGFVMSAPSLDDNTLREFGLTPGSYLLCVGSADPRKNMRTLSEAYASLPRQVRRAFPLVVAGGAHDAFAATHIDWPVETIRTGYVTNTQLAALYQSARLLVVPSLNEGFGLPAVEGAAAGVPLAMSDIPAFRWVYGDGALYFDPRKKTSVADAIMQAIDDPVDQTLLTRKRSELTDRFSWESSASSIRSFVAELHA